MDVPKSNVFQKQNVFNCICNWRLAFLFAEASKTTNLNGMNGIYKPPDS